MENMNGRILRFGIYVLLAFAALMLVLPVAYSRIPVMGQMTETLHSRAYPLFYGMFALMFGMVLFGMSFYMFAHFSGSLRVFFSAWVSLLGGLFVLSEAGLFHYVSEEASLNDRILGYAALLLPLAMLGVLWCVLRHLMKVRRGSEGEDSEAVTPVSDYLLLAGSGILLLGFIIDLLFFNALQPEMDHGIAGSGYTTTMAGLILFCASLLQSYFYFAADYQAEAKRHRKLMNVAYTDPLTGLDNRTRCEMLMQELERNRSVYYLINYDVNGLKHINDTMGHAEGDRYLQGFAQILKMFFKDAFIIGRMGGDEYLVILKDVDPATGLDRAESFELMLHRLNRMEETAFHYEAAYGCAHSGEVPSGKCNDVYQLADDRMFHKKRLAHNRVVGKVADRE